MSLEFTDQELEELIRKLRAAEEYLGLLIRYKRAEHFDSSNKGVAIRQMTTGVNNQ